MLFPLVHSWVIQMTKRFKVFRLIVMMLGIDGRHCLSVLLIGEISLRQLSCRGTSIGPKLPIQKCFYLIICPAQALYKLPISLRDCQSFQRSCKLVFCWVSDCKNYSSFFYFLAVGQGTSMIVKTKDNFSLAKRLSKVGFLMPSMNDRKFHIFCLTTLMWGLVA